ncbi:MAG: hypothetical protein OXH77_14215 [Anaerolineaceae bacterium]|nr:hypothetical protein [Anaerolineaceae bacterium]
MSPLHHPAQVRFGDSAATATIPAVNFCLMLQRYFVRGMSTTDLRG